jgi:hypothetical protein
MAVGSLPFLRGAPSAAKSFVEGVTRAANGADRFRAISDIEGFAQASDMDIDRTFIDIDIAAPYGIEELLSRIDPTRRGHEEFQQPEFGGPQVNFLSCPVRAPGLSVEFDLAEFKN